MDKWTAYNNLSNCWNAVENKSSSKLLRIILIFLNLAFFVKYKYFQCQWRHVRLWLVLIIDGQGIDFISISIDSAYVWQIDENRIVIGFWTNSNAFFLQRILFVRNISKEIYYDLRISTSCISRLVSSLFWHFQVILILV